jgi:hypothetical protein
MARAAQAVALHQKQTDSNHDLPWGRDPFAIDETDHLPALPGKPKTEPEWILSGIIYHPDDPAAVINGRTVFVGSRVDGAKVANISREAVTLIYDGDTRTLQVNRGKI